MSMGGGLSLSCVDLSFLGGSYISLGMGGFSFIWLGDTLCLGLCLLGLEVLEQVKRSVLFGKGIFAITADMEDIEEIQILQDYIGQCGECNGLRCRFMISNVIVFGTGTLACRLVCVTLRYFLTWQGLDFFEHVTGVWCLGMWTDQHRSLYESCVTMDWNTAGREFFTFRESRRGILFGNVFIRGQEDKTRSMVATFGFWEVRNGNVYSIGWGFPPVKPADVKMVIQREISQDFEYFDYKDILKTVAGVCSLFDYEELMVFHV